MPVLRYFLMLFIVITTPFAVNSDITLPEIFAQHPAFHGSKNVAGFHVELTVDPVPIEPGVLTKFGTVFRNATTGEPVATMPHTFVLVRDGQVMFRESTDSAHYMHEFRFAEEHKGPLTVLIENVNNSGESAEFSLMVVPEFPLSATLAMAGILAMMFVMLGFKNIAWKRRA